MQSARRELLQLVHDLDAGELLEINKIEEPDTIKIGEENLDPKTVSRLRSNKQH
jgi:hypothetical protein